VTFGKHALNISRIVALLACAHGTAGGACTDEAAGQQTTASPNGGTAVKRLQNVSSKDRRMS